MTLAIALCLSIQSLSVVVIGDSISDGYGVHQDAAYPSLLAERLRSTNPNITILNASQSGSLTSSALKRVKWHLKSKPDILILQLGGNDALQQKPVDAIKLNLDRAIQAADAAGVAVVLVGIEIFESYGKSYNKALNEAYEALAKKYRLRLVPSILKEIGTRSELMQSDRIHPNAKGHDEIAKRVMPALKEAIADVSSRRLKSQ